MRQIADLAARQPGLQRVNPCHFQLTGRRAQQCGKDAQQRRLPGTVGARQDDKLATAHRQAN